MSTQMKFKRIITLTMCLIVVFGALFSVSPLQAQAISLFPPFGGFVNFTVPCLCNGALWIYFTPLYLSPIPVTGALTYMPGTSQLYEGYLIGLPATWELGDYNPLGAMSCIQYVGIACVPVPSLGMMMQVGTSVY